MRRKRDVQLRKDTGLAINDKFIWAAWEVHTIFKRGKLDGVKQSNSKTHIADKGTWMIIIDVYRVSRFDCKNSKLSECRNSITNWLLVVRTKNLSMNDKCNAKNCKFQAKLRVSTKYYSPSSSQDWCRHGPSSEGQVILHCN